MIAWSLVWLTLFLQLYKAPDQPTPRLLQLKWLKPLMLIALAAHGLSLLWLMRTHMGFALSFNLAASLVMWLTNLLLFFAQLKRPVQSLSLFTLPFTLISLLIQMFSQPTGYMISLNNGLDIHIIISLLAYSMLTLAAFQAILLSIQNHYLHKRQSILILKSLPPLLDMEDLLFRLIFTGVILLTLGLLTGFIYLTDLFAQHVAHKTVLSLIAWLIFTTLLIGHWRYGWRGRIAIRWTLIGSVILMLGFLGSKFVIEYLVQR
ncbi:cytochrome C assembly family protein [Thiofilum flexile]|uniref:cytochrome C assembly family protein n=1 Tax=Thiofilum flexile TaxID=125627 RepID=UPI001FE150D7|nr:cytochrome c biogenesis protein CcsA [Thiofilum flexile]